MYRRLECCQGSEQCQTNRENITIGEKKRKKPSKTQHEQQQKSKAEVEGESTTWDLVGLF